MIQDFNEKKAPQIVAGDDAEVGDGMKFMNYEPVRTKPLVENKVDSRRKAFF